MYQSLQQPLKFYSQFTSFKVQVSVVNQIGGGGGWGGGGLYVFLAPDEISLTTCSDVSHEGWAVAGT